MGDYTQKNNHDEEVIPTEEKESEMMKIMDGIKERLYQKKLRRKRQKFPTAKNAAISSFVGVSFCIKKEKHKTI